MTFNQEEFRKYVLFWHRYLWSSLQMHEYTLQMYACKSCHVAFTLIVSVHPPVSSALNHNCTFVDRADC